MERDLTYLKKGFFGRLGLLVAAFLSAAYGRFLRPKKALSCVKGMYRFAVILAYFVPFLSNFVLRRIEKGLFQLVLSFAFFYFVFTAGIGAFNGRGIFFELMALGQFLTVLFVVLFLYIYPKSVSDTIEYAISLNNGGARKKSPFLTILKSATKTVKKFFYRLDLAFSDGDKKQKLAVVLSFVLPGLSSIVLKRFVLGIIKVALSLALIAFLALRGFNDIVGLITLKTLGVKSNYNIVFGLIAVFVLTYLVSLYCLNVASTVSDIEILNRGGKLPTFIESISSLLNKKLYVLFLSIPVVGVLTFTILPLIYMISVAFTNFATSSSLGVIPNTVKDVYLSWVGFDVFVKLFTLSDYFKAFASVLGWTLLWAVLATFTCYFGGLFLAILINKKIVKWKVLFRSIFVLSMAIPQLVSLRVMYAMFHDYGPLNTLLLNMGLISERVQFWGTVNTAKTLIICINMWVGIPYFMLLMSGLLLNIPKDLYEYARVEGAGRFYAFKKITMPFLLFMTTPLLIMNFVGNINNFNVIWLLTNGGPSGLGSGGVAGGTDILITWLYKLTMQHNPDYNIGSAIGIIMFIISASLSLVVYRNSSSYKKEGDFS